ncbi:M1 family metallopeptidase [Parerythrobacter aestuarii]|uniref:M1 family metallopeptidase n=1 Tax=Parerythrobacter aestuarii TaxID=3020909 RepID=UPI0024DE2512|nr:M1 family metallopeptidase [Parerythrobacter aestuarii]
MRFLAAAALFLLAACSGELPSDAPAVAPILDSEDAVDVYSFAKPLDARVSHVSLGLDLDFENKAVAGKAVLDIIARPGVDTVILDTDGLEIESVTDAEGQPLAWELGDRIEGEGGDEGLHGAPLSVTIGASDSEEPRQITVTYSAANADALQWLSPEQTAGGKHPYLLSQGQATLNRSWIPTQDSPGIRQTWNARITAPAELTVVMSGLSGGDPEDVGEGRRAFTYSMDKPVAPYLIAIAAGDIVFRELGPRTGVWTEPAMIDAAAKELEDTEAMVGAAEELYGPYRWGRYDMIVLPPAFPFGGMENPTLTFLTPTFIAGDKSLTGLVAHELAHSWSGNLVTNANWTDSWLNEGVTTYFENRIVEKIYGEKRAVQEALLDFAAIEETLAEVGTDAPGTALHQPIGTDSAGSAIVYNKGAAFLRTLEHAVGRETFDAWLRSWFDRHAFQPATSAMLLADMKANLLGGDEARAKELKLEDWIYAPGLPDNVYRPDATVFAEIDAAVKAYADTGALPARASYNGWTSAERQRFLDNIPKARTGAELAALDSALGLSRTGNNEELFLWLELALGNRYDPAVPQADAFLSRVGRTKFVRPLFTVLMEQGSWGQPIAKRVYAKTRSSYHAVTQGAVDKVVGS